MNERFDVDFDMDIDENYKGFDLSGFEEDELPEIISMIDEIHDNMTKFKLLCNKITMLGECPVESLKEEIRKEALEIYGDQEAVEAAEALFESLAEDPLEVRMAKAKAFLISYERQFEDDSTEPIHPFEFKYTDLFTVLNRFTGGKNPLTGFEYH